MELEDVHIFWHWISCICRLLKVLQRKSTAGLTAIGERVGVGDLRICESGLAEVERRTMRGIILRVILIDDPLLW